MNTEDSYHYQAWVYDQEEPDLENLFVGRPPKQREQIKGWQMRGYNSEPTEEEKEQAINEYIKRQREEERNDEYLRKHGIK